jgi:hypothetical protein
MVSGHTCGFCGQTFAQDEGQPTCQSCPLRGGCQMVRCPHCGYENPVTPPWVARVRAWFGTAAARRAGYDADGVHVGEPAAGLDDPNDPDDPDGPGARDMVSIVEEVACR